MKTLLAAIVGGILVFAWSALSHMVLPLGTMGFDWIRDTDDEAAVLGALKSNIPEDGLYFIPGADPKDEAAFQAAEERAKQGHGLVVWHPGPDEEVSPMRLVMEFVSNVAAAFVAALVLSRMRASYPVRVFSVALMGVFAWLSIEISYWNWYGFPQDYLVAQGIDQSVGWLIGGLGIAKFVKGKEA